MAKTNEPSLVEQHVEKAVLAVSVVALVAVSVIWIKSSPRQVELRAASEISLAQKAFAPSAVDEALNKMADRMKTQIGNASVPNDPVPDFARLIDAEFRGPLPRDLVAFPEITPGRHGLPTIEQTTKDRTVTLATLLLAVAKPQKPLVNIAYEVVAVPQPQAAAAPPAPAGVAAAAAAAAAQPQMALVPREDYVVHGAVVYEWGLVIDKWREAMKSARIARAFFTVAAVEVERQVRTPDGSWGPSEPVSPARVPATPEIPPLPAYTKENLKAVQEAVSALSQMPVQKQIIEPGSYDVYDATNQVQSWIANKPRTAVSDLQEVPATPEGTIERPGTVPTPPTRVPGVETPLGRRETGGISPGGPRAPVYTPRTGMDTPPMRRETGGIAPGGPRAPAPVERAPVGPTVHGVPVERAPLPAEGAPVRPTVHGVPVGPTVHGVPVEGAQPGAVGAPAVAGPFVPPLAQQLGHPKGIMEIWFHDQGRREGVGYRYRVRLVLINPLFGQATEVADPADAEKLTILTDWSDWSEAVAVKPTTEFFISGKGMGKLFVTVFARKWNTTVSYRYPVEQGDSIGRTETATLPRPDGRSEQTTVDFTTGAVVVDVDFNKPVSVPNRPTRQVTELIYLDAQGKLVSRTDLTDGTSPRFEELTGKARPIAP